MIDQAHRRRVVSRTMAVVCRLLAFTTPITVGLAWLYVDQFPVPPMMAQLLKNLSPVDRLGGMAITMIPGAVAIAGFLALHRLFGRLARDQVLDAENAELVRRFAIAVLAYVPAKVLAHSLTTVWLSRSFPVGERVLEITVAGDDVTVVVIGVLLLTLAWVLRDAAEMAQDHRQII